MRCLKIGQRFIATGHDYRHIRGAYCFPKHRGKGLYQSLLNFVIETLKKEDYTMINNLRMEER